MSRNEIIRANREAGYHFFDPSTMRFFASRVHERTHGRYFVTSEQFIMHYPTYHAEPRKYTVRRIEPDGRVSEIGEFQQYATSRAAHAAARRLNESEAQP